MLSPRHLQLVQTTVPVLRTHGDAITAWFYRDLFDAHPELFNTFNPINQHDGSQARSLAAAILNYAALIERPEALAGMVERIANKHCSLEVLPEHYRSSASTCCARFAASSAMPRATRSSRRGARRTASWPTS
jgi:nitric oxide dioxygenase